MSLKGIKRLVSYGLISLTGFNLFVGCSSPYEPTELSTIEFELDTRMSIDGNGYYHLPMNILKFGWGSNHYWIIGDDFGYFVANTGLTDNGTYIGYDTTYVDWFEGYTVPIVNGSSYSNESGEVNTMMAPTRNMRGDTATIFYGWYDDWKDEEIIGEFYVIFD